MHDQFHEEVRQPQRIIPLTLLITYGDNIPLALRSCKTSRSMKINKLVAEFIALDNMPFEVADSVALQRLFTALEPRYKLPSAKYFRTSLIPDMYNALVLKVAGSMKRENGAIYVSFTTDAWTTPQCTDSLLSLTAHWLDSEFNKHSIMLHASHILGQHTASNIAKILENMVKQWKLTGRVHVMLRDNASSMIKAMNDANIKSFGCVSHTL